MPSLINSPVLGLERIAREACIVLLETVNDAISEQEAYWGTLDQELATARGITYVPITLEPVESQNFYLGHQPSLLNASVDKYPNISVMADHAGAGGEGTDQGESYSDRLWIEIMVKSATANEEEVNARIQRTVEAVNICMLSNPTLRGTIHGYEGAPSADIGEVFTRKEQTAYGNEFVWQGARLEYTVRKEAQMPLGAAAHPASRSPSNLAGFDYDQVP